MRSCSDCIHFGVDADVCVPCFGYSNFMERENLKYPEPPKCHCLGVDEPNAEDKTVLDKTVFPSGAVRDNSNGKGRMDLLPWTAIMEVSKHCQKGAEHYGEHNVDRGIPLSSLCDSGARHLAKFIDGWDDEDHLVAAAWNILWAIQMRKKNPECVDVPWRKNDG